jgi:hypothetical protein
MQIVLSSAYRLLPTAYSFQKTGVAKEVATPATRLTPGVYTRLRDQYVKLTPIFPMIS